MKGDFSRLTFDATKHFSRVLNQQGRVMLDADFNEQTEILLHVMRTMARDLFGPYGGPTDAKDGGFRLKLSQPASGGWHLAIGEGHYYVDGILCECDGCDFTQQSAYGPPSEFVGGDKSLLEWLKKPVQNQPFWIYLDVWERHVTWIEDDSIREVALGAGTPDTCTRCKVVWQVKALPWDADHWGNAPACNAPLDSLIELSTARMAAQLSKDVQITDPCVIAPDAKYRGAENQLYRVEIHDGGSGEEATFKWSRDNGSVATRWLGTDGGDLIVANARAFSDGVWVELSDDGLDLAGTPGVMVNITKVQGDRLSIDPASASGSIAWSAQRINPKVRRWDQSENDNTILTKGVMSIIESGDPADPRWIVLEDGIQIWFEADGQYRTGDYWLIPARVATGSIEWHPDATGSLLRKPFGIEHHYAPLGFINLVAGGDVTKSIQSCLVCTEVHVVPCAAVTGPTAAPIASETAPAKRARKRGSS